MSISRMFIWIVGFIGVASLLAFIARELSYEYPSIHFIFIIFIIPIYLSFATNVCLIWSKTEPFATKGGLFALSLVSVVIAVDIISTGLSGHIWEVFAGIDGATKMVVLFVTLSAIVFYFIIFPLCVLLHEIFLNFFDNEDGMEINDCTAL